MDTSEKADGQEPLVSPGFFPEGSDLANSSEAPKAHETSDGLGNIPLVRFFTNSTMPDLLSLNAQHEQGLATRGTGTCVLQEPPPPTGLKALLKDPPAPLMPGAMSLSFGLLVFKGVSSILPVAAFFWVWSVKNRILGPIKQDAGVFSFMAVILAFSFGYGWVSSLMCPCELTVHNALQMKPAACMLPFLNFAVVAKMMVHHGRSGMSVSTPEQIVTKFPGKSLSWAFWFRALVFGGTVYWGSCILVSALF